MANQIAFDNIQFVSYGVHDQFPGKLNPITAAIRGESEMGGGGGIFKSIVAIAVAIAIPIVAPQIATALGASAAWGGLASAGVGAVIGGVTTSALGGDWRQGALLGGLGGGIGGWQQGMGFTGNAVPSQTLSGSLSTNSAVITNTGSGTGVWDAAQKAYIDPLSNSVIPSQNIAYGGNVSADIASRLSSGSISSSELASNMTNITANTTAGGAQMLNSNALFNPNAAGSGFQTAGDAAVWAGAGKDPTAWGGMYKGMDTVDLNTPATSGGPNALDANGKPTTVGPDGKPVATTSQANQSYWQSLKGRVTDPSKMADMTLMMTPQIIGGIYAAQAGEEQQKRIDQYQAELKKLEGQDQAAYQAKLKEYNDFVAQAKAINPEFWAQQSAKTAQIQGSRSLAESFRDDRFAGLRSPGYAAAEKRRAGLGLQANVGSAYDRGFAGGLSMRNDALSRAQAMYPTAPRGMQAGLKDMASMYADLDMSRNLAGAGASKMASYMTYPLLSKDTRDMYKIS